MNFASRLGALLLLWLAAVAAAMAAEPAAAPKSATFEEGRAAYLAKDYDKAYAILAPLANAGDAKAQVTLGIMYDYGYGVERDAAKAIEWYKMAAQQGVPAVQHDLGVKFYRGQDVSQDYKEAAKWWRMAAENGLADSQYNLGYLYSRGLGVSADDKEALHWYGKAAEQNHMFAQYSLAVMYSFGKGVAVDYVRAAEWFRKAAEQGMAQAQYNLGVLYENGQGVARDATEARKWYKRAADQGLEMAEKKLAALDAGASATPTRTPAGSRRAMPGVEGIHREEWIASQHPEHYTLQVMSSSQEQALVDALRREHLDGDLAYFKVIAEGQPRYTALYGVYSTQAEAETARATLPASLQKLNPWVRKFAAVQKLIEPQPQP